MAENGKYIVKTESNCKINVMFNGKMVLLSKEKPITEIMQKMLTIKICGCII